MMDGQITTLIVLAGMCSVRGNSAVMESNASYCCCKVPAIKLVPNCYTSYTIFKKPIAFSNGTTNKCIPPCKKIEGGWMTLDGCVDVNATLVYKDAMDVIVEKRVYHYGRPCSGSVSNTKAAGNQGHSQLISDGSGALLLLTAAIAGLYEIL